MSLKGKNILVTGGAGLVGTRLIKRLLEEQCSVISLDNYFAGSKENHIAGAEYREGHTKDISKLIPETLDIIFHLGEYSRVEQSVLEPEIVNDLNTVGTKAVVEFWKERKCKLVYAGSSTKFGDGGATRYTSPYARTKAENTELVKQVGDQEKIPYAITYFYNVYGPGERAGIYGTVIENFKQLHMRGAPLTVVAPGNQKRNFTHVDDIIDGLIRVAEHGHGDEHGLGSNESFSVLEIAECFGGEILMLPERAGNRMQSGIDTSKSQTLGWSASRTIRKYIADFCAEHPPGKALEKRILILSTTFVPVTGPAEEALIKVISAMPNVQFDVITSTTTEAPVSKNVSVHRVGDSRFNKFVFPFLGFLKARELNREHQYLFAWSLMASYAALAGVLLRRSTGLPLLITLADQNLQSVFGFKRFLLSHMLSNADQVYGDGKQEGDVRAVTGRSNLRRGMGGGDAFANALRFVYSSYLNIKK